ncbi:MAG: hypothetical protein HY257_09435 [Chloroflexi bacterium]|nr:hypothetical protein [Chloroflexota bacterium]
MTPHSFIAGTVQYMPPEQVDGVRDDPRIDVYSLGAALYQMLAGHDYLNFDRRKIPAAAATNIHLIKTAVPLPPSAHNAAIPPWLDEIILSALAKERAERYDSIDDFLETLTRAQDEERERRVEFSAPAQIAEQIESPTEFVEPRTESREELASPESLRAPITPTRRPSRAVWAGGIVVMIGIVILFVGGIGTARLLTENNAAGKVAAISESQITQEATLVPITTATTTATATLSSVTLPIRTFTASPTQRGTITQTRTTTRASSPTTAAPGATDLSGFRDPGTTFILTEAYIVLGSGAFAFDLKSDSGFKYSAPKITLENQSGKRLSNNEFHFAKFEIPSFSWGSVGGLTSEEYYFADIRGGGSRCMLLTRNITIKLPPAKSLCYTLDSNGTIYILKVSTVWQRADGKIQQIGPDSGELYFSWGPD